MSICGCDYNLNFRCRNSMIEVGMQRIAFLESKDDLQRYVGFPYKKVTTTGSVSDFKKLDAFKEVKIPEWATCFAIESLR